MRTLRLAKVAAQAEGLRLRRLVRRAVKRVAFGAVAAVFALAVLVMLHALVFLALTGFAQMLPFWAALIVFGIDAVFAGIFGLLSRGGVPDRVEVEAQQLRDNSLREMRNAGALSLALGPAGRMAGRGAFGLGRRFLSRKRHD